MEVGKKYEMTIVVAGARRVNFLKKYHSQPCGKCKTIENITGIH